MKNLEKELRSVITEIVSPEFDDEIIDGYISPIMNKIENHVKSKVIQGQIDVIIELLEKEHSDNFWYLEDKRLELEIQLKELEQ